MLPLPGYEAIPAGVILKHRRFLKHVPPEQTRLFMAGLARFAEDPRFGAHRAHGCGLVCVEYRVKRLRDSTVHPRCPPAPGRHGCRPAARRRRARPATSLNAGCAGPGDGFANDWGKASVSIRPRPFKDARGECRFAERTADKMILELEVT